LNSRGGDVLDAIFHRVENKSTQGSRQIIADPEISDRGDVHAIDGPEDLFPTTVAHGEQVELRVASGNRGQGDRIETLAVYTKSRHFEKRELTFELIPEKRAKSLSAII
jgi:hypothetical protein